MGRGGVGGETVGSGCGDGEKVMSGGGEGGGKSSVNGLSLN